MTANPALKRTHNGGPQWRAVVVTERAVAVR